MIIDLIKQTLIALTTYLQLKNKSMFYSITRLSRAKQKELINEIEKNRTTGTNDSNDHADLLRKELIDEQRFFENISTYYIKIESKQ